MNDDLDLSRGMCLGFVLAGILWVLFFGGLALLIAWSVK